VGPGIRGQLELNSKTLAQKKQNNNNNSNSIESIQRTMYTKGIY
jgi:hypothetical protein